MSDKIELLPCPFCGGKAHWPEPEVNIHYVGCMSCAARATGVEDWNRRAAIDQQPAPAVPAGWKLVPAKPTTDMCNAAAEATGYDDYHGAYVGYIAMLAAAPAAPVVREPVAFVSQETFSSDGTSDILTRNLPIGTALYAVPPAAEQAPRELFTCIGKGGRYELLGESSGAGGCRREGRVIYRCLDTGQLYHRTDDDFAARMAPLTEDGEA